MTFFLHEFDLRGLKRNQDWQVYWMARGCTYCGCQCRNDSTSFCSDMGLRFWYVSEKVECILFKMLRTGLAKTTYYRPQINGFVERIYRHLTEALMFYKPDWLETLLRVLLGLRTTVLEYLRASIVKLTYGTTLRLPGQFYEDNPLLDPPNYILKLQKILHTLRNIQSLRHGQKNISTFLKHYRIVAMCPERSF